MLTIQCRKLIFVTLNPWLQLYLRSCYRDNRAADLKPVLFQRMGKEMDVFRCLKTLFLNVLAYVYGLGWGTDLLLAVACTG